MLDEFITTFRDAILQRASTTGPRDRGRRHPRLRIRGSDDGTPGERSAGARVGAGAGVPGFFLYQPPPTAALAAMVDTPRLDNRRK